KPPASDSVLYPADSGRSRPGRAACLAGGSESLSPVELSVPGGKRPLLVCDRLCGHASLFFGAERGGVHAFPQAAEGGHSASAGVFQLWKESEHSALRHGPVRV